MMFFQMTSRSMTLLPLHWSLYLKSKSGLCCRIRESLTHLVLEQGEGGFDRAFATYIVCAKRGRLLLQTTDPVPFGTYCTYICFSVEIIFFSEFLIFSAIRISNLSLLLFYLCKKKTFMIKQRTRYRSMKCLVTHKRHMNVGFKDVLNNL